MASEILFVVGPYKTGTSTLLGILNCHDDILLEYEISGNENYRDVFLEYNPGFDDFFNSGNIVGLYSKLAESFGSEYRFVGEKIATLDEHRLNVIRDKKIIFIIRDINDWIVKRKSLESLVIPGFVWPHDFLKGYTKLLLSSFLLDNCLRISMEGLLYDSENTLSVVEKFIGLEGIVSKSKNWHKKIGNWNDSRKCVLKWWQKHPSSLKKPTRQDTKYKKIDINKRVEDVFYKYYNNLDTHFKKEDVLKDLKKINET